MFKLFRNLYKKELTIKKQSDGQPITDEMKIGLAILLLDTSGKDGDYAPEEIAMIKTLLENNLSITADESLEFVKQADNERKDKDKISYFFKLLNTRYSREQRILALAMACKVASADGKIEQGEARFVEQIKTRLQLTNDEKEQAWLLASSDKV